MHRPHRTLAHLPLLVGGICLLLAAAPRLEAKAKAPQPIPAQAELFRVIDELHGPCGHWQGRLRLSNLLLDLAPPWQTFTFSATVADCAPPDIFQPLSETEMLYSWLARYERDPSGAFTDLVERWETERQITPGLQMAGLLLLQLEKPEVRHLHPLLALAKASEDPALKNLGMLLAEDTLALPQMEGEALHLDSVGAQYDRIFKSLAIRPGCDCPSQPRGTPDEIAWAEVFLGLHPSTKNASPPFAADFPQLASWLEPYHAGGDALGRAQAAVVIWNLAHDAPPVQAESAEDLPLEAYE